MPPTTTHPPKRKLKSGTIPSANLILNSCFANWEKSFSSSDRNQLHIRFQTAESVHTLRHLGYSYTRKRRPVQCLLITTTDRNKVRRTCVAKKQARHWYHNVH
jgi:hypothetical protein